MENILLLLIVIVNFIPHHAIVTQKAVDHTTVVETFKSLPKRVSFISPFGQRRIERGPLFKSDGMDLANGELHPFVNENIGQPIYTYIVREKRSPKKKHYKNKQRRYNHKKHVKLDDNKSTNSSQTLLNSSAISVIDNINKSNNTKINIISTRSYSIDDNVKGLDHTDMSFNEIYNDLMMNKAKKFQFGPFETVTSISYPVNNDRVKGNPSPKRNELFNNTVKSVDNNKVSRNIYDRDISDWKHNPVESGMNTRTNYLDDNHLIVLPKAYDVYPVKPISEEGIIKVLAMLTKAFKKIMKEHDHINKTYSDIVDIDQEFKKQYIDINEKMREFAEKYNILLHYQDKLKTLDNNLITREQSFINKQKEFSDTMTELQNQQRKFLTQQHEFYNIQKIILAQNEKINSKQEDISKSQDNISLRLFNSSYIDNIKRPYFEPKNRTHFHVKGTTSPKPKYQTTGRNHISPITSTAQPMKINLLNVPKMKKIMNLEQRLLSDKDFHTIDDIVYKYYFNNTYIDNLIKSKILNEFSETFGSKRNIQKRLFSENQIKNLLKRSNTTNNTKDAINSTDLFNLIRNRRWLNHETKRKYPINTLPVLSLKSKKSIKDEKVVKNIIEDFDYDINQYFELPNKVYKPAPKPETGAKKIDPFAKLAKNYCNALVMQSNKKDFKKCVEKTKRKLRLIEYKKLASFVKPSRIFEDAPTQKPTTGETTTKTVTTTKVTTMAINNYFPDNEELETKLKEYELKPDEEGNVYFDGSVHSSDLPKSSNDDLSGFPPYINSDSRIEIDPITLDLQSKRSEYVQRMNDKLLKDLARGIYP